MENTTAESNFSTLSLTTKDMDMNLNAFEAEPSSSSIPKRFEISVSKISGGGVVWYEELNKMCWLWGVELNEGGVLIKSAHPEAELLSIDI